MNYRGTISENLYKKWTLFLQQAIALGSDASIIITTKDIKPSTFKVLFYSMMAKINSKLCAEGRAEELLAVTQWWHNWKISTEVSFQDRERCVVLCSRDLASRQFSVSYDTNFGFSEILPGKANLDNAPVQIDEVISIEYDPEVFNAFALLKTKDVFPWAVRFQNVQLNGLPPETSPELNIVEEDRENSIVLL